MTLKIFLTVVWVSVGLLIVAKVYEAQGNHKMMKVCTLFSSILLVLMIVVMVASTILSIGRIFV